MADGYSYGMWVVVVLNVGIFLFFTLSFIKPKGHAEWRNMGIVLAFLVALFSEMYGFPLTIYLLTGWLGEAYPVLQPFSHKFGHLWVVVFGGSTMAWVVVMGFSLILLLSGYGLLSKGWRQIHGAQGKMVTEGVYAFVRHPQYTGLFLVIIAFLVQWPTLLTVLMAPILLFAYTRLAQSEEKVMYNRFGEEYKEYAQCLPRFFPAIGQWFRFITASSASPEINPMK
ncbi:MAG: isoprenylcysteine carboxylmethyltransferase family protein [Gammaproteobacteria bacterium]|nr:isoprenylcysteine carboxylmethyltransferase family protein [Gammaproteobacteria bacterium]